PTHTHGVGEVRGARPLLATLGDFLLDNCFPRLDAPRFADVGVLREAVGAAHNVGPQKELWRALLGLQPVQEAETDPLGVLQGFRGVKGRATENAAVAVVVAWPVEHRYVVAAKALALDQ